MLCFIAVGGFGGLLVGWVPRRTPASSIQLTEGAASRGAANTNIRHTKRLSPAKVLANAHGSMQGCLAAEWERAADLGLCQGERWLHSFVERANAQKRSAIRTTLVVGGNKAYDCVGWLRLSTGNQSYGSATWTRALQAALPSTSLRDNDAGQHVANKNVMPCGVCGQCKSVYPMLEKHAASEDGRVVCVEPLPANYEVISRAAEQLGWKDALQMVQAAGSNVSGTDMTADFPKSGRRFGFGAEAIGIGERGLWDGTDAEKVRLVSVDNLIKELRIVPDVLLIDAEGHDPAILAGARQLLASASVGLVQFEKHAVGMWASTRLSTVIIELDGLGYVCFWSGLHYTHPILPGLSYPKYKEPSVGNILCAHHKHRNWLHALGNSMSEETCKCLGIANNSRPNRYRFRFGCNTA